MKLSHTALPAALLQEVNGLHRRQLRLRRTTLTMAVAALVAFAGVLAAWLYMRSSALPAQLLHVVLPTDVVAGATRAASDVATQFENMAAEITTLLNSWVLKAIGFAALTISGAMAMVRGDIGAVLKTAPLVGAVLFAPSLMSALIGDAPAPSNGLRAAASVQTSADKGNFDEVAALLGTQHSSTARALVLAQTALVAAGTNLAKLPEAQRAVVVEAATAVGSVRPDREAASLPDAEAYLLELSAFGEPRSDRMKAFVERMRERAAWAAATAMGLAGLALGLTFAACSFGGLAGVLGRRFRRIQGLVEAEPAIA